jgi:RimJ/RimL family protein N-acetyltransferase
LVAFIFFSPSLCASSNSFIGLDVEELHRKASRIQHSITQVTGERGVSLKPTYLMIYKKKSYPDVTPSWEYPLELDFNSHNPQLLFNDLIPDAESLKHWDYIRFGADIFLNTEDKKKYKIGSTQHAIHHWTEEQETPHIYLINIVINEEYQAKGYGTAVALALSSFLKDLFSFTKRIELVVDSENPKVAMMARRFGFSLTPESKSKLKEQKISEEDYFNDCRLMKKLRFVQDL